MSILPKPPRVSPQHFWMLFKNTLFDLSNCPSQNHLPHGSPGSIYQWKLKPLGPGTFHFSRVAGRESNPEPPGTASMGQPTRLLYVSEIEPVELTLDQKQTSQLILHEQTGIGAHLSSKVPSGQIRVIHDLPYFNDQTALEPN